jgi:hypothetical protein
MSYTLDAVEAAVRASWSLESCDPVDVPDWSPENPSRGQCGVTSLVLQDWLGGEMMICDMVHADGSPQGVHYWNRFPGGIDVDLTWEQFRDGELIVSGSERSVGHPERRDDDRIISQYRTLSAGVTAALKLSGDASHRPRTRPST